MTEATTEVKEFDLDGMMDDLADLASFDAWPTGAYLCHYDGWERKKISEHDVITRNLILDEVKKIDEDLNIPHPETGEAQTQPKAGDACGDMYMVDIATGQGFFKKNVMAPLEKKFGPGTIRNQLEAGKGKPMLIIYKRTWNKDKARYYGQIVTSVYL